MWLGLQSPSTGNHNGVDETDVFKNRFFQYFGHLAPVNEDHALRLDHVASVVNVETVGDEDGFYSSLKGNELKRREEPSLRVIQSTCLY